MKTMKNIHCTKSVSIPFWVRKLVLIDEKRALGSNCSFVLVFEKLEICTPRATKMGGRAERREI